MYQYIYEESVKRAKHKIWILSDLQQKDPACARECLDISMADYESMDAPADMIWYLGDSIEGTNREHLLAMCQMQEEAFGRTGLPLCYVMGNHELDYSRAKEHDREPVFLPFYEMVKAHEGWYTTPAYTEPYFKISLGDFKVYFFSDHIAEDKSWMSLWGNIQGKEYYPHEALCSRFGKKWNRKTAPLLRRGTILLAEETVLRRICLRCCLCPIRQGFTSMVMPISAIMPGQRKMLIAEFPVWTGTTFLKSMCPASSISAGNFAEVCFCIFMRITPLVFFFAITMQGSFPRFIFRQRKSR